MSLSGLKLPTCTEAEYRAHRAALLEQGKRATLDHHCEHTDLNAHKTRCLSCGLWVQGETHVET